MSCPAEIGNILLNLMTLGILRIRAHCHDPNRCLIEADHIHNLPLLIANYSCPSLLLYYGRLCDLWVMHRLYYWEVERPSFIKQIEQIPEAGISAFEDLWNELRVYTESHEFVEMR